MQNTIKNKAAVQFLYNIVYNIPVSKKGTYNRVDFTHFEQGSASFTYKERNYTVEYYDCTWGIEISITEKTIPFKRVASFYIDGNEIVLRQKGFCGCLLMFAHIFPETLQPYFIPQRLRIKTQTAYMEDPLDSMYNI